MLLLTFAETRERTRLASAGRAEIAEASERMVAMVMLLGVEAHAAMERVREVRWES